MTLGTATLGLAAALFAGAALGHASGDDKKPAAHHAGAPVEEKAFGRSGESKKASRTIRVEMSDAMRFTPAELEVHQNDTVRFIVRNAGKTMHEMVLGTLAGLKEHHALMKKYPGMEHDEPYMAHVAPGKSETILWQFTRPGEFYYGCLIPGHFEAGMIGRVIVK